MNQSHASGVFIFLVKFLVLITIFGGFPVFLTLIVKNYNRQAEGIIAKRNSMENIQDESLEEIRVLTQEDARVLQDINRYILGEWKNTIDKEYVIRYEADNSFTEYKGNTRVGYGLWRITITRKPRFEIQSTSTPSSTADGNQGLLSDTVSTYKILRYQFESGKKSAPNLYDLIFLDDSKLKVLDANAIQINFER